MDTLPLSEAKTGLSALVEHVHATNDRVTITRHGRPAALLISVDEMESIEETLYLLSVPGMLESLEQAHADSAAGNYVTGRQEAEAAIAKLRADYEEPV